MQIFLSLSINLMQNKSINFFKEIWQTPNFWTEIYSKNEKCQIKKL